MIKILLKHFFAREKFRIFILSEGSEEVKICTITCHDVYNYGASLQAYALMKYLTNYGHNVEIIDYKPDYLSNHYRLLSINNKKWEKNIFTKSIYLMLKIPGRILELKRKKAFDHFTSQFLNITKTRYQSNKDLEENMPQADVYICGSDQIWNSLHKNGKDPAFYLDFVPDNKIKASYAASFATETILDEIKPFVKKSVKRLNFISVREKSGVRILKELGVQAANVVDPVFLLDQKDWDLLGQRKFKDEYVLVYDFDNSELIKKIAIDISKAKGYKIYSVNRGKDKYADQYFIYDGPKTFISLLKSAKFVVSNSFHAAVFSIIYEKPFAIINRTESINTRMGDLLDDLGLRQRLIDKNFNTEKLLLNTDYREVKILLREKIRISKEYLNSVLSIRK